jgi:hypothetical protein
MSTSRQAMRPPYNCTNLCVLCDLCVRSPGVLAARYSTAAIELMMPLMSLSCALSTSLLAAPTIEK